MSEVKPIPEGFRTVTPHLTVTDGEASIEFYKKALGAEETLRMPGPGGQGVMHAELKIGDSIVFLADEFPGNEAMRAPENAGAATGYLMLYFEDVDAAFGRPAAAADWEVFE